MFTILSSCTKDSKESFKHKAALQLYIDGNVLKPSFGGKIYTAHTIIGTDPERIYVWAFLQESYTQDKKVVKGVAWSVPLILKVKNSAAGIKVVGHEYPRNGNQYKEDIQSMFPKNLQQKISDIPQSTLEKNLETEVNNRANEYIPEEE